MMIMKRGIFMQKYSLIPATLTTNIKHGICNLTDDRKLEISFDIYKKPDNDMVYKACACSTNNIFSPINLGTAITENNTCHLLCDAPADTENCAIVIYLKDTKTSLVTYEGYCVLNDKPVIDIKATENNDGMFDIECVFEDDDEGDAETSSTSLDNAQKVLELCGRLHHR